MGLDKAVSRKERILLRLARAGCLILAILWTLLAWRCAYAAELAANGGWAR